MREKWQTAGKIASFYFFEKLGVFKLHSDVIPKSKKACTNAFHENWSGSDGGKVIHLKAHGLLTVASVLERYVEAEMGKRLLHKINHLCTTCLKTCTNKRKVTKFFATNDLEDVKKSIQNQVRKINNLLVY